MQFHGSAEALRDFLNAPDAIHTRELARFRIMAGHRRRLGFVHINPLLNDRWVGVVRPTGRLCALHQPRSQFLLRNLQREHASDRCALGGQEIIERNSLGSRPGKAVKNETLRARVPIDLRFEHANGDIVRHEVALVHVGFGQLAQICFSLDIRPENVSSAQVNQIKGVHQERALRALPCPRWAKQYQIQHFLSLSEEGKDTTCKRIVRGFGLGNGASTHRIARQPVHASMLLPEAFVHLRAERKRFAMNYDVVILGSGPGGYVTAIRASQLGLKTAVIERESLGGICLNWGCIPTKALLKSANVFEYIQHAQDYGISVADASVDFSGMISRSRGVADGMSKGVQFLMKKNNIDVIYGEGKVLPGKQIEVVAADGAKSVISGTHVIIATGARSRELPSLPQDGKRIIGYRKAMTLEEQPKRLVVVGSGAIGVEFAYMYNAIGTEVTVVEYMDRIVPVEDAEVSKQLERSFKKSGIKIMTSSEVTGVDTSGPSNIVTVKTKKGEEQIECDVVLSAAGVVSNIENIGLEEVGIVTDKGKILVNDYYETNIPGYYAIGDCVPGPALAHVASAEGITCVEKIAGHSPEPIDYGNIPGCTYCFPEVASVGMTEQAAKDAGHEIRIGKFPFSASGKASASGHKDGFVKLIFDAKYGELLGGHMIGANVTEMIAEIVAVRKLETTGHELIKTIHPHPTLSEAVMEAAAAAYDEVIHL